MNEHAVVWIAVWLSGLVAVACVYALVWVPVSRALTEAATALQGMQP